MKKIYLLLLILNVQFLILNFCHAQAGEWVWMHGSSTSGSAGSPGLKGVPSASNEPPALYEACEWTDLQGHFWMFGGLDNGENDHTQLWEYDTLSNEWTWMSGPNTVNDAGNYGTQGVPSASNYPPSKSWGVASWVDLNGNFWMFGGDKSVGGAFSDLWEYDVSSGLWTWMKGPNITNQGGTYGALGVPNAANNPGCRWECPTAWTDKAGDLWLFGGIYGAFNDLWRYHIATNTWTWMKGSQTTGHPSIYGVKGIEDSLNTPGGRGVHARWTDKCGYLWLFGGVDVLNNFYNDLWRFNPATNNWAWMGGDTVANATGFYGTQCTMASSNKPGARSETRATWTDTSGNLWMFGGGLGGSDTQVWDDLWMYCLSSNQWVWESGDSVPNPAGSWGTLGVASATNKPNGRAGSVGWTDHNGNIYFFGGTTTNFVTPYNDLWKYTIDPGCGSNCSTLAACAPPSAAFQSSDSVICSFECINYADHSIGATAWQWIFAGASPSSSTDQNPQNICYQSTGTYSATLIVSNSFGNDTIIYNNYINVYPAPVTPSITQSNDTLFCSVNPSYVSFQWYDNSILVPGATNSFFIITQNGNYNVSVVDTNGCSIAVGIVILGVEQFTNSRSFALFPNPAENKLYVDGYKLSGKSMISIYNILGELCYQSAITNSKSEIDISTLSAGIYYVKLADDESSRVRKFIKQ